MENGTKERILDNALESFALNGYKGTNLRDLAAGMGLSKSALYKYFKSKEEIRDAVYERMELYYAEHFGSPQNLPPVPKSCEELCSMTARMLNFTMHDRKVILTRRFLLTEQFGDERARRCATQHFNTGIKEMYMHVFDGMIKNGTIKNEDPEMLAFMYTSSVSSLIFLCDREPERADEIMRQIKEFIGFFIKTYGIDNNEK